MAATGLHKRVWGATMGEVPTSTPQQDAAFAGVRSTMADQPTRAISRNEKGDTMEFRITAGLDQGDPFSPLAFTATLPLGELQNAILQAQRVAGVGRPVNVKSTSPLQKSGYENTTENGYENNMKFNTSNEDMHDAKYINKNDTNTYTRNLHKQ